MDNNNQTPASSVPPQASPPAPANIPVQPGIASQPQMTMPESGGESKKPILWLAIGLIVIVALVGGIYFFLNQQNNQPRPVTTIQTPSPSPIDENLEAELSSIDVESGADTEFATVDQDLSQL